MNCEYRDLEPIKNLASIRLVCVLMSFFDSSIHSWIFLTLCPTSNPISHKVLMKEAIFVSSVFLRVSDIRMRTSTSE